MPQCCTNTDIAGEELSSATLTLHIAAPILKYTDLQPLQKCMNLNIVTMKSYHFDHQDHDTQPPNEFYP